MQRRTFLGAIAAAPFLQAAGDSRIKLGFDTYSLRAFGWKDMQLIDWAAEQHCDTIQISSMGDFLSLEPAHLAKVRAHAESKGMTLDAGTGCICPVSKSWKAKDGTPEKVLIDGLKAAKAIGSTSMRCYMGSSDDRASWDQIERCMDATIKVFRSVKSQAQDFNVKIALENHAGDMQARETRDVIEQSGKDFVAANLDTGNPMWVAEDPVVTMEILGPYTVTTHVRDSVVFEHPRGAAAQWVALGEGVTDLPKIVELHRKLCPQAAMQLEIITGRPPRIVPYFEPVFWKAFPKALGSEFARFVELARKGHPFMGTMVIEDAPGRKSAEYSAALKEQQRADLARSLDYARSTLGVGVRTGKS
jgi:sugar phosphate isomerase/epimerase